MDLGLRMLLRLQITMNAISDQRWVEFLKQGYLRLGCVLAEAELRQLCYRIDEIMLGRAAVDYDRMLMQLDPGSGDYGDLAKQSKGFKVATLNHRKIQDLEYDPVFLEYLQRPLFRHICARAYGPETDVACFRSMFMNKPAHGGYPFTMASGSLDLPRQGPQNHDLDCSRSFFRSQWLCTDNSRIPPRSDQRGERLRISYRRAGRGGSSKSRPHLPGGPSRECSFAAQLALA